MELEKTYKIFLLSKNVIHSLKYKLIRLSVLSPKFNYMTLRQLVLNEPYWLRNQDALLSYFDFCKLFLAHWFTIMKGVSRELQIKLFSKLRNALNFMGSKTIDFYFSFELILSSDSHFSRKNFHFDWLKVNNSDCSFRDGKPIQQDLLDQVSNFAGKRFLHFLVVGNQLKNLVTVKSKNSKIPLIYFFQKYPSCKLNSQVFIITPIREC